MLLIKSETEQVTISRIAATQEAEIKMLRAQKENIEDEFEQLKLRMQHSGKCQDEMCAELEDRKQDVADLKQALHELQTRQANAYEEKLAMADHVIKKQRAEIIDIKMQILQKEHYINKVNKMYRQACNEKLDVVKEVSELKMEQKQQRFDIEKIMAKLVGMNMAKDQKLPDSINSVIVTQPVYVAKQAVISLTRPANTAKTQVWSSLV